MAAFTPQSFEPVMAALFDRLCGAATIAFAADATPSSAVLTNCSTTDGLFPGLPVFGEGVCSGVTILAVDADARTVTLTDELTEALSAASFTTGFLTTGRRVQHWSQVTEQPALFLRRVGSDDAYSGEMPITELECEVWIYSKAGEDPDAIPDEALSNLDWMIRQAFAPDVYGDFVRNTIGNRVYWARIHGRSDYSPGDQTSQGISRIPVRITLQPQ